MTAKLWQGNVVRAVGFAFFVTLCPFLAAWARQASDPAHTAARKTATPADGYTVHVTAPHMVNGHVMGPFHHYCKVIAPDPQIVCQIYDNTDPNAPLSQIEFIMAKKLTRPGVKLNEWNRLWHDHATEIAGGRVQVLDLPPDKAQEVADLVATTDGIIYSFQFDGKLPNGKITMAQAVGHKPLTATEYEQSRKQVMTAATLAR
jgi:Protein of unknown function (DUF1264)